ncbi:MAG: Proline iminopeptidase [Acinetobacter bereziniae]|uniref:Proline iminopeptidase n=1 Tax=Acinetobacter bereziniae TaxID=106648 RepID=A0A833PCL3_ACIBZ|nr:MAG: Proline iminopeptidase [Acinetobacter bereziniae]
MTKNTKEILEQSSNTQLVKIHKYLESSILDYRGDTLFSRIYPLPEKESIILLHGGPGFPSNLTEVVEYFKNQFQVIVFHQRGTKKSPSTSADYSLEAYINDIETVRKFYKIDKFHLWGHSWGGLYAQVYAEKNINNLLSLFLCSPGSGTNTQWQQTENEVMHFNKSKVNSWEWAKMGINSFLGMLGCDKAYQRLFKQVMKNYNSAFTATEDVDTTEDYSLLKAACINKTRAEIIKYPLLSGLPQPDFKITILYGDQDIYSNSKHFVIDRYPTASIFSVLNSGHLPWLHNPQAYETIFINHYQ